MFDYRGGLFAPGRLPTEGVPVPFGTPVPALDGALAALYQGVARFLPNDFAVEQALLVAVAVAGGLGAAARAGPGGRGLKPAGRAAAPGLGLAHPGRRPVAADHHLVGPPLGGHPRPALVQFPQRFNGPLSLCVALAAATGLAVAGSWRPLLRAVAGVVIGLLALSAIQARPYIADTPPPHDVDGRTLAAQEIDRFGAGTTSGGEFLPRTVYWEQNLPGAHRGLRLYDDVYPQAGWQAGLVRVLDGQGAATAVYQAPGWVGARVEGATPLRLAVHQLLFPGWRAYLDGQPTPLAAVPDRPGLDASLGFMVLEVPAGEHHVEVRFGPTPARAAGAALSAAALAYVLLGVARGVWPALAGGRLRLALALLAAGASLAYGVWDARPRLGPAAAGPAAYARVPLARGLGGASRVAVDVAGAVAQGRAETAAPGIAGQGPLHPFLDVRSLAPGLAPGAPAPRCGRPPAGGGRAAPLAVHAPPRGGGGAPAGAPPGLLPGRPGPRPQRLGPAGGGARGGRRGALRAGSPGPDRAGAGAAGAPPQPPRPGRGAGLGGRVGRPRPPGRAGGAPGAAHGGRGRPPLRLGRLGQPPGRPLDRGPPPPRHASGLGHLTPPLTAPSSGTIRPAPFPLPPTPPWPTPAPAATPGAARGPSPAP